MNPLYDQIFNQQYVNNVYVQQLEIRKFHSEQEQEIEKAVNALRDYCVAARKIAPEYREMAVRKCIEVILTEMSKG